MVEIKIGKNNNIVVKVELKKFLVGCLIFAMVIAWVFSGWPRIWQEPPVPPEIEEAQAAISFGTPSFQEADGSSFTFSHFGVSGTNPLLIVVVHADAAGASKDINTVQCESTDLTVIINAGGAGQKTRTAAYYLAPTSNPGDGYCDDLVITRKASDETTVAAVVLTGVDQDDPVDTGTVQSWVDGKATSQTLTVTGTNSGDLVMDAASTMAGSLNFTDTGQTEQWNRELGGTGVSGHYVGASTEEATGASVDMTVNNGKNEFMTHIAFNINQAVAANPPVVEAVSLTLPSSLIENTTTTATCTATIYDAQGGNTIESVTTTIYRSGVSGTSSCETNYNNCYTNDLISCETASSSNYFYATCTTALWFHAEPTDVDSPWSGEHWKCYIIAKDSGGLTGASSTPTSTSPDLATLLGLIITSSIDYGTLTKGATSSTSSITYVTTTGNAAIDVQIRGTDMTTSSLSIPGGQQRYATSSIDYPGGTALSTTTFETLQIDLPKPEDSPSISTAEIYWRIGIPADQEFGTYYGTTSIAAILDQP